MNVFAIATARIPSDTAHSIQVMKTCQAIRQTGHRVHLLVPGQEQHPWERLAGHYGLRTPFEIQWLPAHPRLGRYDFSWAAVRRARRLNADLLYVWALQAAVGGLRFGSPVALELHGPPEGNFGPRLFHMFLRSKGQKRLLPITRALAEILEKTYGPTTKTIDTVIAPNGVDLERFEALQDPAAARRQLSLPEGITVGYTGHLYAGRGMALLTELARRFPAVNFLWVGGRPDDVRSWKDNLLQDGLENVHLTGFIENQNLPQLQAAMDILLMPYERVITGSGGGNSADYCSPMKLFEYLATGRAIISSDLPVFHEILDKNLAILCPPDDPAAWADALKALIEDPTRRRQLGANAREAAGRYTWQTRAAAALAGFPPAQAA